MGPFEDASPLAAIEQLHDIAVIEVKPAISEDDWNTADLVRMRTSLGVLRGDLTDREAELESITYSTLISGYASNTGIFSW